MSESGRTIIPKQPGSQYSNDQRMAAIADFAVTGNITKTADMNNIPRRTIGNWIKSEWGVELLAGIRHEKGEELDANLTKLIDSAYEQAQDRIENGDYRVTKDGKLFRVPMGGYQLVISGSTIYDKRQLHRNQPTSIQGDSESISKLVKQFEQISRDHNNIQNSVVSTQGKTENCTDEDE